MDWLKGSWLGCKGLAWLGVVEGSMSDCLMHCFLSFGVSCLGFCKPEFCRGSFFGKTLCNRARTTRS